MPILKIFFFVSTLIVIIIFIENLNAAQWLSTKLMDGVVSDIKAESNFVYVITEGGLTSIDMSDPKNIFIKDTLKLVDSLQLVINSNRAYILHSSPTGVLSIVNISNPVKLELINTTNQVIPEILNARGFDVVNNISYITDVQYGLSILDLQNELEPTVITTYRPLDVDKQPAVCVKDFYLYTFGPYNGLMIFDIKNPQNPSLLSNLFLGSTDWNVLKRGIAVEGQILYLADSWRFSSPEFPIPLNFYAIDISDKYNPTIKGSLFFESYLSDVEISGNYAFVASENAFNSIGSVVVIDKRNPETLRVVEEIPTTFTPNCICIFGNFLLVGNGMFIDVFDISEIRKRALPFIPLLLMDD